MRLFLCASLLSFIVWHTVHAGKIEPGAFLSITVYYSKSKKCFSVPKIPRIDMTENEQGDLVEGDIKIPPAPRQRHKRSRFGPKWPNKRMPYSKSQGSVSKLNLVY